MNNLSACKGKFITFEGIEGVGKSTQLALFTESVKNAGVDVVTTREPGGTEIAEAIRGLLLSHHQEVMTYTTELLLLFAARAQHITTLIKPALQAGKCVICDRFTDSTYAYQGGGRGIYLQNILQLENLVQGDLRPDLTILLNAENVSLCLTRARAKGSDRIELEELAFFERAKKLYIARANGNPGRFRVIDATKSIEEVQQEILKAVNEKFSAS